MIPFFTIITPTINRTSLDKCIRSVDAQSYPYWEHIVMNDRAETAFDMTFSVNINWLDERRKMFTCIASHHNFGNTCRHNAWKDATGRYLIYLDDDNYLADKFVLERIEVLLGSSTYPDWALFPILKEGQPFFDADLNQYKVDTANLVVKREHGRWPDTSIYAADYELIYHLKAQPELTYQPFPLAAPIVVYPKQSLGEL